MALSLARSGCMTPDQARLAGGLRVYDPGIFLNPSTNAFVCSESVF